MPLRSCCRVLSDVVEKRRQNFFSNDPRRVPERRFIFREARHMAHRVSGNRKRNRASVRAASNFVGARSRIDSSRARASRSYVSGMSSQNSSARRSGSA